MASTTTTDAHPVGVVPVEGRGSLPFALLHGESLVAVAVLGAGRGRRRAARLHRRLGGRRRPGGPRSWSTTRCARRPRWPSCARRSAAAADDAVVVGRPAGDRHRQARSTTAGVLGETVDRAGLLAVASPVVLPRGRGGRPRRAAAGRRPRRPGGRRCARGARGACSSRRPPPARRVADESDLRLARGGYRLTRPRPSSRSASGDVLGEGDLEVGGRRGHRRDRAGRCTSRRSRRCRCRRSRRASARA